MPAPAGWSCPVCGSHMGEDRFAHGSRLQRIRPVAGNLMPSSEMFGYTSGRVLRCLACGHASVADPPKSQDLTTAYADTADAVSLREEAGQVETARRALRRIEAIIPPGRVVDLGCWTGSFLVAAQERGWEPVGIEPSTWAANRARERGIEVHSRDLFDHGIAPGTMRMVVMCDVIEHLTDPARAVNLVHDLLEPGGVLYLTVPNAGSLLARALGRRWWSVLPMHLQYFTPGSMRLLLRRSDLRVHSATSHAKAYSARYYAERLRGYSDPVGRAAVTVVSALGLAERMVGPDLRDRLAVIAIRDAA